MQKRGLKTPSTNSTSGSMKQRLEPRPVLERSWASWQIGSRYKKKKDPNIYNSGQYGIGTGSCVLPSVFLLLLLPSSLHHLLQALPLSFLLQVNFTECLKNQINNPLFRGLIIMCIVQVPLQLSPPLWIKRLQPPERTATSSKLHFPPFHMEGQVFRNMQYAIS